MGDIHDFEPVAAHCFERGNSLTNPIDQDFATSARDGTEAGGFEVGDNFVERLVEDFAEMNELARTKAVDIDLRKFRFYVGEQIQIPLFGEVGMVAALHQNLSAAQRDGVFNFPG